MKKLAVILLFIIFLSLFTILYSLFPINAFAQTAAPSCAEPVFTGELTRVTSYPYKYIFQRFIPLGQTSTTFNQALEIPVNFAELPAIFAGPNSNFLESRYQDPLHNTAATTNLDPARFNAFHAPAQKAAPAYLIDDLKIKFISYLAQKPFGIDENSDTYTDANGQNPRTAASLIAAYGGSPQPPSHGGNQAAWQSTWGPYWDKIPTAVNEYFWAFIIFMPLFESQKEISNFEQTRVCGQMDRQVFFPMPSYFRTTSTSNQINQLFLPKVAQSSKADFVEDNLTNVVIGSKEEKDSRMSRIFKQFGKPLTEALKRVFKISFTIFNPVKNAFAQADCQQPGDFWDPNTGTCTPGLPKIYCPLSLPIMPTQKPGEGPFCSLPREMRANDGTSTTWQQFFPNRQRTFMQVDDPLKLNNPTLFQQRRNEGMPEEPNYYTNETCLGNSSSNNLDGGPLVNCTFKRTYIRTLRTPTPSDPRVDPLWDYCQPRIEIDEFGNGALVGYDCQLTVSIYLNYWIPWLSPIWNNTTYSDTSALKDYTITDIPQLTGRPGSYNLFTSKSVEGTIFPDITGKVLPSQEEDLSTAPKQRFFGAVDNFKKFVRDCALKPKALQDALGVNCQGEVAIGTGATRQPTYFIDGVYIPPPPPPPPDPGPGYDYPLDDISWGWY